MQRLIRAVDSQNPETADRIISEILKIQFEIENISKQSCVLAGFVEEILNQSEAIGRMRPWDKWIDTRVGDTVAWTSQKSSVFLGGQRPMGVDDFQFLSVSKMIDFIFDPVVRQNPNIVFLYAINTKGFTRGFPQRDFSVLPPHFNVTEQSFFYIADEEHNPERRERWTEPYLCPLSKIWMVTCSSPVYQANKFKGVVGIDVSLGRIIQPLGDILNTTNGGYAFLISANGNLIISSDAGMSSLTDDRIVLIEQWSQTGEGKESPNTGIQTGEITLTSGRVYFLYKRFRVNDWALVCVLPRDMGKSALNTGFLIGDDAVEGETAMEEISRGTSYQPLIGFVSSFNQSLKQMEKLIAGTTIIGKGMLSHRIAVETKDELGLLAISINKMAKELKKRKDEVETAYKRISQMDRLSGLGRLTAGIAHEINNPLGIISNYIQILARDSHLSPQVREDIRMIEEEIERVSEIIKGLLNFSGDTEAETRPVQVNEILQKTVALVRLQLRSQRIALIEGYDDSCPLVTGNATHLKQAFLNIMLNAIESMASEGRMEVRTRFRRAKGRKPKNHAIEIVITDTGHGIEKKVLDKIFDPFFSLKKHGRGTGLGLSISYGIIKEHDGTIHVSSALGKGTTITIALPLGIREKGADK